MGLADTVDVENWTAMERNCGAILRLERTFLMLSIERADGKAID